MPYLVEPVEFEFYKFLNENQRATVDEFISKLDPSCQAFALKRYSEDKTIQQIAEEMGYSERNLFKFRRKILLRWYFHCQKVS